MRKLLFLALLCLMLPGCGIILFPITVPLTIADNHPLRIRAIVTDSAGQPPAKTHVIIGTETTLPNFWESGEGAIMPLARWYDKSEHDVAGNLVNVSRWTHSLTVTISAPDCYPRTFGVEKDSGLVEYLPRDGLNPDRGTISMPFTTAALYRLELARVEHPQKLLDYRLGAVEFADGRLEYIALDTLDPAHVKTTTLNPNTQPLPPNSLFITAPRTAQGDFAIASEDPRSYDRHPKSITLHCNSPGGGFIRVPLENGRPPGGKIRQAPASGYASDLVLSPPDFANHSRCLLYFKTDHLYGLGAIDSAWTTSSGGTEMVGLSLELFLQPDGSTNIE